MVECNENTDEAKLSEIALFEHENECVCYYTDIIVLGVIALTVSIGIGAYFAYTYIKHNKESVPIYDCLSSNKLLIYKMGEAKQINIKNRTYYFYEDMINIKNFDPILLKIDRKSYKDISIYSIGYITIKKIDDCETIDSASPLYLLVNHESGYIEEKVWINT